MRNLLVTNILHGIVEDAGTTLILLLGNDGRVMHVPFYRDLLPDRHAVITAATHTIWLSVLIFVTLSCFDALFVFTTSIS